MKMRASDADPSLEDVLPKVIKGEAYYRPFGSAEWIELGKGEWDVQWYVEETDLHPQDRYIIGKDGKPERVFSYVQQRAAAEEYVRWANAQPDLEGPFRLVGNRIVVGGDA